MKSFARRLACAGAVLAAGALAPLAVSANEGTPQRGGTLVVPIHLGEPGTYDCHGASTVSVMYRISPHYSKLVKIVPEKYPDVIGDLAESWKVSPDGLRYEFTLRDGIKFHDGSELSSNDVRVSYDRLRNPPPGVVSLFTGMLSDVVSIEAPDARTVVFNLKAPNASMLQILGMPYACVYSAKLLASDPSYPTKKIMGTGPFKFVSYSPGGDWIGARFDDYFIKGLPYLDGFRMPSVTTASANNAMIAGQVHYTMIGTTPSQLERVTSERGDKVRVVGKDSTTSVLTWLMLNTERPPLNDVRVRRAIALALDHYAGSKAMTQFTAFNVVGGLLRPGSPNARTEAELQQLPGFSRDIEASRNEARRLLAEAGHPNLKLVFLNNSVFSYFGVYLADQLRQIGVTVDHQAVDGATLQSRAIAGSYDIVFRTPPEYLDDPTVNWSVLKPVKNNPANYTRMNDPKFDEMYEAQKRVLDPKLRREQLRELESYLLNQAYVIPFFWHNWTRPIASEVRGVGSFQSTFMKLDLADIWLDPKARR